MRMQKSICNDMKFQLKYGFYLLYLIITIIYIAIILMLPASIRRVVSAIVVFSDPAALGLFFMGAIVLFEKSERVLNSLFISPLKLDEYILAKVVSLSIISTFVGCAIVFATIPQSINWSSLILGVLLGSILFSLSGLIVATRVNTLNQFMIGVVPVGTLLSIPPIIILFGFQHMLLSLHPGVIVLELILQGVGMWEINPLSTLILLIWIVLFWSYARINVKKMISSLGGVKL